MSSVSAIPSPPRTARLENWSRALYRFRQSWLSIIGLAIVVALILIALLAPFIVPTRSTSPAAPALPRAFVLRHSTLGSEPTRLVRTCSRWC